MPHQPSPSSTTIRKRPRFITLAAVIFLLFSTFGWLRFQQAVVGSAWLNTLNIFPPPPYFALTGALWGLVGLLTAIALFTGWRSAPRITLIAAGFFVLSYWLDYLLFNQSPAAFQSLIFEITISLLGLLFAAFLPRLPGSRRFFNESSGN
jgi:hypothetical protein